MNFILDGCIKCGKPIINYSLEKQCIEGCSYCLKKSFYFDKVISCVEYTEISKRIVFGLKYNNKTYLSKYISTIMKEKLELENIINEYVSKISAATSEEEINSLDNVYFAVISKK